jgi:hypothetical protein
MHSISQAALGGIVVALVLCAYASRRLCTRCAREEQKRGRARLADDPHEMDGLAMEDGRSSRLNRVEEDT